MADSNLEPSVFKELPKQQQKALRKEYDKATKASKSLIIYSVIAALLIIAIAIGGIFGEYWIFGGTIFPACFLTILIALNEEKFTKWLKNQKNIVIKRKKS